VLIVPQPRARSSSQTAFIRLLRTTDVWFLVGSQESVGNLRVQ
jgi:hypothetical protein